eukprot:349632-Chlamydomonas_euryale.AAC.52
MTQPMPTVHWKYHHAAIGHRWPRRQPNVRCSCGGQIPHPLGVHQHPAQRGCLKSNVVNRSLLCPRNPPMCEGIRSNARRHTGERECAWVTFMKRRLAVLLGAAGLRHAHTSPSVEQGRCRAEAVLAVADRKWPDRKAFPCMRPPLICAASPATSHACTHFKEAVPAHALKHDVGSIDCLTAGCARPRSTGHNLESSG